MFKPVLGQLSTILFPFDVILKTEMWKECIWIHVAYSQGSKILPE